MVSRAAPRVVPGLVRGLICAARNDVAFGVRRWAERLASVIAGRGVPAVFVRQAARAAPPWGHGPPDGRLAMEVICGWAGMPPAEDAHDDDDDTTRAADARLFGACR